MVEERGLSLADTFKGRNATVAQLPDCDLQHNSRRGWMLSCFKKKAA